MILSTEQGLSVKYYTKISCIVVSGFFFTSMFILSSSECKKTNSVEQVKRGNFLLPTSQQPGALFSLGQNIVDKGDILGVAYANFLHGPKLSAAVMNYGALYGITDRCSLLAAVPYSFFKLDGQKNSGLSDIFGIIEYALYQNMQRESTKQATIIGEVSFPTGSVRKRPLISYGGPSYLIGATLSYYSPDWFCFVSFGGVMATQGRGVKTNSSVLYESGFGKNIGTRPGWIFAWMVELNGIYSTREQFCGVTDRNTGSNILFMTPSLWISSEKFFLQAGLSFIPAQHFFGCQNRPEIGGLIYFGWKFNS